MKTPMKTYTLINNSKFANNSLLNALHLTMENIATWKCYSP